ncbi:MAG: hypothetical protein GX591_18325 [Planctomycetes bacterium]|nr:hypothetical protein [Planctomycetota bacterium]
MRLPFTVEQFFDVFEAYNRAIWPAQVLAYVLGLAAIVLASGDTARRGRAVAGILALSWIWMGAAYHLGHFRAINPAATVFGVLFLLQGLVFIGAGCILAKLRFRFAVRPIPIIGAAFILYAMVLYPLLGRLAGHIYPRSPVFGVAPCPAAIFTFGLLLWATRPVPWYVPVVPVLWSLIGLSAAIHLRVPQDYGLGVAGVFGIALLVVRNRMLKQEASPSV